MAGVIPSPFAGLVVPRSRRSPVAICSFQDNAVSGTDTSSYSFPGMAFGEAAGNRYILVTGVTRASSGNTIVTSLTIGGIPATELINISSDGSGVFAFIAAVPTGASGTIVVTFGGNKLRCGIGVYRVTGLQSTTPVSTATNTSEPANLTVDVVAGGFAVAIDFSAGALSGSNGWTGLSQDFLVVASGWENNGNYSGASANFATAQSNLNITHAFIGSAGNKISAAVSMR